MESSSGTFTGSWIIMVELAVPVARVREDTPAHAIWNRSRCVPLCGGRSSSPSLMGIGVS